MSHADDKTPVKTNTKSFAVKLGATRVIYDPDGKGATLAISNPQDYPMLVQSTVKGEDTTSPAPFVVTPPLFRLDGKQQNRLRIVRTGGVMPADRETLEWLCVKGIPPKSDDAWANDASGKSQAPKANAMSLDVQLSISNCIKLLVRPSAVKGTVTDVGDKLTWRIANGLLTVKNPTPFYMNFASLQLGRTPIPNAEYVAPFGSKSYPLPKNGAAGQVQWKLITDYGGETKAYQSITQ
ncbi:fimbria/pilus periplasmic chaperone [Serratia marcescens]|nr:fimbria/pilus periplasmic chaperone [Serratia marcescens]MBH2766636.1 fimbria/pilus periplasmic chaperone [Serratia marcescens]MBH2766696.1 fimbria/pilus periplasmic chaperone [Serratia marcescens]